MKIRHQHKFNDHKNNIINAIIFNSVIDVYF